MVARGGVSQAVRKPGPRVVQATAPRRLSSSTSKSNTIFINILFLVLRRSNSA